jgi:hypothetical protein
VIPESVVHVRDIVAGLADVTVRLDGSSATGDRTALSDWDFDLQLAPDVAVDTITDAMNDIDALAVFWDPLSRRANLIVMLDGPVKIDLIAADRPNPAPIERWSVTAKTLTHIDAHFWDWTLWLGSKHLRGETALVHDELKKMHSALLEPLGAAAPSRDITTAVDVYIEARDTRATELGASIDQRLQYQVVAALRATAVIS